MSMYFMLHTFLKYRDHYTFNIIISCSTNAVLQLIAMCAPLISIHCCILYVVNGSILSVIIML